MELKQSRIWDKRHFILLEEGIWVRYKTPAEDAEFKVKYEDLGFDVVYVRKKSASVVFGSLIFLASIVARLVLKDSNLSDISDLIILVIIFTFILGALFLAWYDSRKSLIGLNGGEKSLALIRNSPDAETVDKFVNALQERVKNRIIQFRVRPTDQNLSFAYKKHNLDLLLEENIIDQKRYKEVLAQINVNKPTVGFNRNFFELN